MPPLPQMKAIDKLFGATTALDEVDCDLAVDQVRKQLALQRRVKPAAVG